jgi:hypothetical protein
MGLADFVMTLIKENVVEVHIPWKGIPKIKLIKEKK